MKLFISTLFLFVGAVGLSQNNLEEVLKKYNRGSISYISVNETRMLQLQDKIIVLDAREIEEFEVSHLPFAHYIGYHEFSGDTITQLIPDKDQFIVVYCSLGIRSEIIAVKLKKMGYQNVRNLYGGIFEWSNKELPLIDKDGYATDQVHIYSNEWAPYLKQGKKVR